MKRGKRKYVSGAASFYIVAFSTLVLTIIATSFATVILSEITRSMNDELSQAAYDAALAGVEDAKIAFANYQRCKAGASGVGGEMSCDEIEELVKEGKDCGMVGKILGRVMEDNEVKLADTIATFDGGDVTSETNQAYTCAIINTKLKDYKSTLSSSDPVRVMKAQFMGADGSVVDADSINYVKISWYRFEPTEKFNIVGSGKFPENKSTDVMRPPVLEVRMVQTSGTFSFDDLVSESSGGKTDRATMYLMPVDGGRAINSAPYLNGDYIDASGGISAEQVAQTNDQTVRKVPFGVQCSEAAVNTGEFACSVTIGLPKPIGGTRNNDTFMFMLSLPYEQPDTVFALEFSEDGAFSEVSTLRVANAQVSIDVTGRANDLFRRIETRLESADTTFPYPYYALELTGDGNVLDKSMIVTCEGSDYNGAGGGMNDHCT